MKKSDLKNGMVVEIRNKERYLVCGDRFMRHDGFLTLDGYDEDLLDIDTNDEWDVVAVYPRVYNLRQINDDELRPLWRRHDKSLLSEKEKEYLEFVLKPFRSDITYIKKDEYSESKFYLYVKLNNDDSMCFPNFTNENMYKGLDTKMHYTPKELCLWEDTH